MRFKSFILLILLSLFLTDNFYVSGMDTLKFKHNVRVYPVIEGGTIGYEHLLPAKNNKFRSYKAQINFRKNDLFSLHNGSENYQSKSIQLEYRFYLKKNSRPMNGIFHGLTAHAAHFEGNISSFMLNPEDFMFSTIPVWGRSVSAGYLFGYQKTTRSGFNFDVGYTMQLQKSSGYDFQAYWLDLIPYRPFVTGLNSRVFMGIGLAF